MAVNILEVMESPVEQASYEQVAYVLDTTNAGGSPGTSPNTRLYQISNATQLTGTTYLSGSATVSTNNITTPIIKGLSGGQTYRLEVDWAYGSNRIGVFCLIKCPV
uniref:Uncharacterized protein n=1 Tax=viral metagenome TaxID=1070528 RepID=A0A6M3KY09_9ZZZZ